MARLIYSAIASLDGFVADANGEFDWAAPDEQVHRFVNDTMRSVGTHLYGRRMYETMRFWETAAEPADQPDVMLDFAELWQRADKVVYSSTLAAVSTARTRLERTFDPAAVADLKAAAQADLAIGGSTIAGQALRAGLVDELQLFLVPTVVGDGTRALPAQVNLDLQLIDEHRFDNGTIYLRYAIPPRR
jgi:dihydrofolate reductase